MASHAAPAQADKKRRQSRPQISKDANDMARPGKDDRLLQGLERSPFVPLAVSSKSHLPVLAAGSYGNGRVVALGDSSPFDDGTGDPEKALHDSMDSFLYEHNQ